MKNNLSATNSTNPCSQNVSLNNHYQEWLESGIANDLINYLAVGGDE